ncbi:DUF1549 and DUF1553 domain-containing protein [Pirellulales bacterium]|nr:DUF1549 and DUF1553 domain-containing protein [Pirellulales bacterium]
MIHPSLGDSDDGTFTDYAMNGLFRYVLVLAVAVAADSRGSDHWAFQPLVDPAHPPVQSTSWPRSQIDYFILAQLESRNLQPAPDADRVALLRRVYFQLIGLPPTPAESAAFLEDQRPDALPRVVDQLLNSRHFGERWGRLWLDLARYADSNGLDENFLFREAWRYRNWVIDAVNDDMPFNRFLLEQLAGDMLPYDSLEQRDNQRIAAGFLVVGPKVLLGNDPIERRMDIADEQLDTIGKAVLGQTLGCARCHDHKFDPIPTKDYYALAGILTSTQVMEQRYMLGEQRHMERLVGLGPDGDKANESYEKYWRELPELKQRLLHARRALELLESDAQSELAELAEQQKKAVAANLMDAGLPLQQRIEAQRAVISRLEKTINSPPEIPPRAMIPGDIEHPRDESIRVAGAFDQLDAEVPRGFLGVLSHASIEIPAGQSGRVELARWLTDIEQGAGHLAARVLANRIWRHLLGEGLVRTVDNLGRTGERPSHPGLLDYLAQELIHSGSSVKHLIRQIVLSRTFAISSQHDSYAHGVDPENRLLWRAHRRRLDPESIRDAMLQAAGTLDLTPLDSSVWYLGDQATAVGNNEVRRRTDFPNRSVYLPVIRNDLPELFEVFDFADPHATTGARPRTMAAAQGLFMLNDPVVAAASEATAKRLFAMIRVGTDQSRLDAMFDWMFNVPPTDEESRLFLGFIGETKKRLKLQGDVDPVLHAWSLACQAGFSLSRFQFLE